MAESRGTSRLIVPSGRNEFDPGRREAATPATAGSRSAARSTRFKDYPMYKDALMSGSALPPGTVCVPFDDAPGETTGPGPGPRTLEPGECPKTEGARGAFVCGGKDAADCPDVLLEVMASGHLLANR